MDTIEIIPLCDGSDRHLLHPAQMTPGSKGYDLAANIPEVVTIHPGHRAQIPCGFALVVPASTVALVCSRSGMAWQHGVVVLNAPGVIDSDYRGEIKVLLVNHGDEPYCVSPGDRIAQLVFVAASTATVCGAGSWPVVSTRGLRGCGSTGT